MNIREQFEQEMTAKGWGIQKTSLGDYIHERVALMWIAWQAASKASEETIHKMIAEVSAVITACEHVYAAGYQAGHLNTVDGIAYENDTREEFAGLAVEVLAQHMEIPAIDKFRDELQAQGVEAYADNLDSSADDAERNGFDDAVKFLRSEASGVRLFATQLRQGADHE